MVGLAVAHPPIRAGAGVPINWAQLQRQLHATDEDWKVLGPKIARVVAARPPSNNPSSNAVLTDMAGSGRAPTVLPPAGGLSGPPSDATAQAASTTRPPMTPDPAQAAPGTIKASVRLFPIYGPPSRTVKRIRPRSATDSPRCAFSGKKPRPNCKPPSTT